MGGKLGNNNLAQFKLGDSQAEAAAAAAVVVSGMFDRPTPAAGHFDQPTPA